MQVTSDGLQAKSGALLQECTSANELCQSAGICNIPRYRAACHATGDSCAVWRYFESVPDELSSMRTHEAAAVADRHLR